MPGPDYAAMSQERRARLAENTEAGADAKGDTDSEFPKHTGGGWYELSNGDKVQGKEDAEKAEAKLS